jgi:hypothetical protein
LDDRRRSDSKGTYRLHDCGRDGSSGSRIGGLILARNSEAGFRNSVCNALADCRDRPGIRFPEAVAAVNGRDSGRTIIDRWLRHLLSALASFEAMTQFRRLDA